MTFTEFDAAYESKVIPFDSTQGWPNGSDYFYRCLTCDEVIPAASDKNIRCACKAITIDADWGRFSAADSRKVVVLVGHSRTKRIIGF
jgi:hypothetical protein